MPVKVYELGLNEITRIGKKYVIISVPYKEVLEHSHNKCPNCTSIFNYELHLRSFDEVKIKHLLLSRGFKCVDYCTTGKGVAYRGHRAFQKMFYPEQVLKWNSPICPICGYSEIKVKTANQLVQNDPIGIQKLKKRKLISFLSYLPKLFWPKISKDYWIIALYERK